MIAAVIVLVILVALFIGIIYGATEALVAEHKYKKMLTKMNEESLKDIEEIKAAGREREKKIINFKTELPK
jgi:uncharacterized protein YneF (UPF0154 family)